MQFHGVIGQTFPLDEGAHVLSSGDDGPTEVAERHALLGSRRAQLSVTPLHLGVGHSSNHSLKCR